VFTEGASFNYAVAIGLCAVYFLLDVLYARHTKFRGA